MSSAAVDVEVIINHQYAGQAYQLRNRGNVLGWIVRQFRKQQRVDRKRPADRNPNGGAVRLGLGDRVGAEIAACPRLVLDDKRMA
jgi:hypothetical protein